ncbi:hypothetical protein BE11_44105 [Sorangium cellulosum]|nr:hypothetical protein BE11_44105 [Sorangium cellulosum]
MDLANVFAQRGLAPRGALLMRLRLAFAARDIFRRIESAVGTPQALGICRRVIFYANEMLLLPRGSTKSREDNDYKMRLTLVLGALGRNRLELDWVAAMLNRLWKLESDPVWRTSIRAVMGSWFVHLQEVTAKLGPFDEEKLVEVIREKPTQEYLDSIAYLVQASKEELMHEPGFADAMLSQASEGGALAALELKIHATEASNRGDILGAIELLRASVAQDPTSQEIHFRLGANLCQIGDVDAGLTELEIAVQLDPSWDRSRVEIAIVLLNEGRDDEALAKLEAAKRELPTSSTWVLLHLAYTYERLGRNHTAIETYEELLGLDADQAEALDRVAHLYFITGDKRTGADRAKKAAHLGIATVSRAWQQGYYGKKMPVARPAHNAGIDHLLQFSDSARRGKRGE